MRPSTRAFFREARAAADCSWFDLLHGYGYARWPYLYIGIATGEHPLARVMRPIVTALSHLFSAGNRQPAFGDTFADSYHGKVVPLVQASQLVAIDEDITLTNLEQVIPYNQACDIILRNPDHIVVLECPCRAARAEPCHPLDVCLIVGEPFASFVAEHHPRRSRWISSDQALAILAAENRLGHVHHAFFKDAMLGRFYAICNCCACCCGAMQAYRNGTPMLASSGYVAVVDADLCAACGSCAKYCQFVAISIDNSLARIDAAACMGCGVCVAHCPQEAIFLLRDPAKGEPLEIQKLIADASKSAFDS